MCRYMIVLVLFIFISVSPGLAVDTLRVTSPDPILEPWRWTAFDRSSGLGGAVRGMFEDRDGNMWFATDRGAQQYDGYSWVTYTTEDGLAHNRVSALTQTWDGAMWFATRGGISRFDPSAGSGQAAWTTYTTDEGLPGNINWPRSLLQVSSGALWAGFVSDSQEGTTADQGGICRFDGKAWETVEVPGGLPGGAWRIYETSDGSLWFVVLECVLRFDGRHWTRYTNEDGLAGPVFKVLEARDGSLWFACHEAGISRFDGKQWKTYTVQDGLPGDTEFHSLWQMSDGTIWAAGGPGALCRFENDRWRVYTSEEIPQLSGEIAGLPAKNGAMWFADSVTDRVFRLDYAGKKWRSFVFEESLSGGVPTPDGSVWFGAPGGAVRYNGSHWLRYTSEDGLLDAPIYGVGQTGDGSLWFGAGEREKFEGLSRYRNGVWTRYTKDEIGLDSVPWVHRVLQAADGSFWVIGSRSESGAGSRYDRSGSGAASRYDGQTWRVYTPEDGLAGPVLNSICQAENGDLWFGTTSMYWRDSRSGGLLRFDGADWISYTTEQGLSHNRIYDLIKVPNGMIYAGTYAGLSWFDGASWRSFTVEDGLPGGKPSRFRIIDGDFWFGYVQPFRTGATRYDGKTRRTYTTQDGLVNNSVHDIYGATDGTIWFGTAGGASRFDGSIWTSYTADDGLPGNWIQRIFQSADRAIWFVTVDGKVGAFYPNTAGPKMTMDVLPEEISSAGNVSLRWSGRDLWDGTVPHNLRYQWRVDGGAWSSWSNQTGVTLTSLSPGRHRIEVQTVDGDGNLDATPAVHAFVVQSPWWRNPWFAGPILALLGLLGVQTGRLVRRDRRLQEQTERKSRFLASMSHELRTPMNAIIGFTRLVLRRSGDALPDRQRENLNKVTHSANHLLDLINSLLDLSKIEAGRMDVDVKRFDVKGLIAGCCAEMEPLVEAKPNVTLEYAVADDAGEANTDRGRVRQIVINLLSNAIKFTEGGEVEVRVAKEGQSDGDTTLVIAVSDTGTGIPANALDAIFEEFQQVKGSDPQHRGTGLGLPITKGFAELLGGSIGVQSEVGKGATFTVRMPMVYEEG